MQVNTLYSAEVAELEIIMRKFPDGLKGIIVEEVCSPLPILFTCIVVVKYILIFLGAIMLNAKCVVVIRIQDCRLGPTT